MHNAGAGYSPKSQNSCGPQYCSDLSRLSALSPTVAPSEANLTRYLAETQVGDQT